MGSVQSTLTVAGLIVAGSAAVYYFYGQSEPSSKGPGQPSAQAKTNKPKKRGAESDEDIDAVLAAQAAAQKSSNAGVKPHVVEFPEIVPGTFAPEKELTPKPETAGKEKKSKKKKTKKTASAPAVTVSQSDDASSSADDPNASVSALNPEPPSTSKKKKKDKAKKAAANQDHSNTQGTNSSNRGTTTRQTVLEETPDDGPWTRVESRKRNATHAVGQGEQVTSDAGVTTSVTETSSLATEPERTDEDDDGNNNAATSSENRKTFVEKMLPKPRKTGVEDMLETPLYPTLARVIRVQPEPGEKPAEGFTWEDYEDVVESDMKDSWQESADGSGDDGWGVVKSRSRPKFTQNSPSSSMTAQRTTAPETLNKRQRQNRARHEAEKSAKADAEAERRMALEKHRKELEKVRIDEQWKKRGGKVNDSTASVSEKGSLVWS